MKSIRTDPLNHATEGDERIRTAEQGLGTDSVYDALERITEEQPAVLKWLRDNGVVFRRPISFSTDDEVSWESIAFWIYTSLCRVDHIARSELLARAESRDA